MSLSKRIRHHVSGAWFVSSGKPGRVLPKNFGGKLAVQVAILVLAVLYTLYFANTLLIPVVAAILLFQLLQTPVRSLHRLGIPQTLSAAVVLIGLLAIISSGANLLAGPAQEWLLEAPASIGELRRELQGTSGALDDLRQLGEEVDEITTLNEEDESVPMVRIREPGHLQAITGSLPRIMAGALLTFVTCFFLLIQGEALGRSIVRLGPTRLARRRISNLLRGVSAQVSTYLMTVTLINIGLGVVVTLVMYGLGVPHPELWGVIAGVLNFAPYVGPAVTMFVLAVVGITNFDTLSEALLVPAAYAACTTLEGMVITPMILGRRVRMSSLWVFLSVVFWGWMWGAPGALMAVPLTASIVVFWQAWQDSDPFRPRIAPV